MKKTFHFAILACLISSVVSIWWLLANQMVWTKIGLTVLSPLVLVGTILLTEVVLISIGLEENRPNWIRIDGSVRGLVGCAIFLCTLFVIGVNASRYVSTSEHSQFATEVDLATTSDAEAKVKMSEMISIWQDKLQKIVFAKQGFETQKHALTSQMTTMGFRSSEDIAVSQSHRKIAEELLELQSFIKALDSQQVRYELAIDQIQTALRRLERQEQFAKVDVSNDELKKLIQVAVELDDRLQSGTDQSALKDNELDALLNETFQESVTTSEVGR